MKWKPIMKFGWSSEVKKVSSPTAEESLAIRIQNEELYSKALKEEKRKRRGKSKR